MAGCDQAPGRLASAAVRGIAPYAPGKPVSELERELGIAEIVKLASNENPLGPSPSALAAMRAALDDVWLYPDGSGHELKVALAQHHGVGMDQITLGNGSNDVLVMLAEAFLTPQTNAVVSQHAFAVYELAIQATGARTRLAPAFAADAAMPYGHDLDAMLALVDEDTRLVFVANPNNPTGTWLTTGQITRFLDRVPKTAIVVLDEAYFEYALDFDCPDGVALTRHYPNLVAVRTFSKAHALAGVRVGYGVSHPDVADVLNRIRQPFNVGVPGLAGAQASISDAEHARRAAALAVQGRAQLAAALPKLGVRGFPSAGNFMLVDVGRPGRVIYERLLRRGVIVRPVSGYGLPDCLRITFGTAAQNERLIGALAASLGDA
ncbi:MAG: histidinol-phosphate transaminase [Steroidobacteraceae bacterium]